MGLAVARDWAGNEAALSGFEILQPLIFVPDASREILCRVSSSTATIEIMSRPRLSKTAYATHARGKIIQKPGPVPSGVSSPAALRGGVESAALYERARASGLEFGPAYRQLGRARLMDGGVIEVELTPEAGEPRFGLDPARLDSCFHGLILLFAEREGEGSAYLPVRFEEVRLIEPGASLAHAAIRVNRHDNRVIVADFDLFDGKGRLAAILRGARYQAVRRRANAGLEQLGLVRTWISSPGNDAVAPDLRGRLTDEPDNEADFSEASLLIEGWATTAAFQLARQLATDNFVDVDALILEGRLPAERRFWLEAVFADLEQSGLMERVGPLRRLIGQALPAPNAVHWTLATQHPDRAPELLLAAHAAAVLRDLGEGTGDLISPSDGAVDAYELRSPSVIAAARVLGAQLRKIANLEVSDLGLRVLQIGAGPATSEAVRFASGHGVRLTIFDSNPRRLERARLSHGRAPETSFSSDLDGLSGSNFDLVVSAGGLSRFAAKPDALTRLVEICAQGALIIAVEPSPSLFNDLVLSLKEAEFGGEGELRRTAQDWTSECGRAGLQHVDARHVNTGADHAILLIAETPGRDTSVHESGEVVLVRDGPDPDGYTTTLLCALKEHGAQCRIVDAKTFSGTDNAKTLVWLVGQRKGDAVARRCGALYGDARHGAGYWPCEDKGVRGHTRYGPSGRRCDLQFRPDARQRDSNDRLSSGRNWRDDAEFGRTVGDTNPLGRKRDGSSPRRGERPCVALSNPGQREGQSRSRGGLCEPNSKRVPREGWSD